MEPNDWLEAHTMAFAGGHVAPEPMPTNDVPTMRPEMRTAQKIETAVSTAKTVVVGGTAVTGTVAAVKELVASPAPAPVVPVPPAPDLSALSEWQVAIQTGKGLALFAYSHVLWIAAAAALYWLACVYWPKRSA
jgi:phosphoribosylcarboxyaminoimidazole (NCAIR) mutase